MSVSIVDGVSLIHMRDGIRMEDEDTEYLDLLKSAETKRVSSFTFDSSISHTAHPWHGVCIGEKVPDIVNGIIEIPAMSRVKTELDKQTGLLKVDRILHSSVIYPANYGFIPQTLAEDGDPLDILVLCQLSVPPLSLMRVRPVGMMPMVDCGEADDKIIAVAINDPEYNIYYDISELPPFKLLMINQFFNDYKSLEKKEVKTFRPLGSGHAKRTIVRAQERYLQHFQKV